MSAREVTLLGGSPWGFRMHGGRDLHQPLRISRVNPGSKAAQQGVREGDLISSINGKSTRELTNSEAHALLRNAGDHLKLGLNQENIGSPKRRIYKSSLQENTSTETLKKITTKTITTSNTRIISTEAKKNGADDTKSDQSYANQNGGLKSSAIDQRTDTKKGGYRDSLGYVTDAEGSKMPSHGSRNRRNRKNRNRRRFQRPATPDGSAKVAETVSSVETAKENAEAVHADATNTNDSILENAHSSTENISVSSGVTIEEEDERSDGARNYFRENRFRIKTGAMDWRTRTVEIKTISSLPLEARIDHIAGVGILETGNMERMNGGSPSIRVDEPLDFVEPLSDNLNSKVKLLDVDGSSEERTTRVEDSSETEDSGPIIVEIESDVEKDRSDDNVKQVEVEQNAKIEIKDGAMSKEIERKLRNFIEDLKLPNSPEKEDHRLEYERICENVAQRKKAKRRAILEAYYQSQAANRFLDIIQEEGEKLSGDEEQHIRDFINEEIGKYRRAGYKRINEIREDEEYEEDKRESANKETDITINIIAIDEENCKKDSRETFANSETTRNERTSESTESQLTDDKNMTIEEETMLEENGREVGDGRESENTIFIDDKCEEHGEDRVTDPINVVKSNTTGIRVEGDEEEGKIEHDKVPEKEVSRTSIVSESNKSREDSRVDDIRDDESEDKTENGRGNSEESGCELTSEREDKNSGESKAEEEEEKKNEEDDKGEGVTKYEDKPVEGKETGEDNKRRNDIETDQRKDETENPISEFPKLETNESDRKLTTDPSEDDDVSKSAMTDPGMSREDGKDSTIEIRPPTPPKRSSIVRVRRDTSGSPALSEKSTPVNAPVPPPRSSKREIKESENAPERPPLPPEMLVLLEMTSQSESTNGNVERATNVASNENASKLVNDGDDSLRIPSRDFDESVDDHQPRDANFCAPSKSDALRNDIEGVELGNEATPKITGDKLYEQAPGQDEAGLTDDTATCPNGLVPNSEKIVSDDIIEIKSNKDDETDNRRSMDGSTRWEKILGDRSEVVERKVVSEKTEIETIEERVQESSFSKKCMNEEILERSKTESKTEETFVESKSTSVKDPSVDPEAGTKDTVQSSTIEKNTEEQFTTQGDFQGQDSSSSAASVSTVKYVPIETSLADVCSIIKEEEERNERRLSLSNLKSKLSLLKSEGAGTSGEKNEGDIESPQPIPYSPIEDLYYVPLHEEDESSTTTRSQPVSLKDLSLRKILTMPFGVEIIRQLTSYKLNIFKSLQNIRSCVNNVESIEADDRHHRLNKHGVSDAANELAWLTLRNRDSKTSDGDENAVSERVDPSRRYYPGPVNITDFYGQVLKSRATMNDKEEPWLGVSTTRDPRLLLCLSPSQQKASIRTSADRLLDLHTKFLNRRSYHDVDESQRISPTSYRVIIQRPKDEIRGENEKDERPLGLLNIIKQNSSRSTDRKSPTEFRSKVPSVEGQERLKATRLCDWMNLARYESSDSDERSRFVRSKEQLSASSALPGERPTGDDKSCAGTMTMTPSGVRGQYGFAKDTRTCDVGSTGSNLTARNRYSPLNRSPITFNSAIIDKNASPEVERRTPPPPRRNIDPRYNVNPALIDDRVEVPPRSKRTVTVDRSCIDTTSIFDQNPPRSHLETRRRQDNGENLKKLTATEIVANLKKLQNETMEQLDGHRRYSLPQEYFDQQLKYIELLENQLKNVILAEEEERKAFEDFQYHVNQKFRDPEPERITPEDDKEVEKESWEEKSRDVDENSSESFDKAGSRDFCKKIHKENGVHEEETVEKIESSEHRVFTRKGDSSKLEAASPETKCKENGLPEKKTDVKDNQRTQKIEKSNSCAAMSGEAFRQRMYDEYVHKVLEREERKHHKVVKISLHDDIRKSESKSKDMSAMEREFIEKAKNRLNKFGIKLDESEPESENSAERSQEEDTVEARCLIDGKEIGDARKLPKHLREFLKISVKDIEQDGVWSPGSEPPAPPKEPSPDRTKDSQKDGGIPPVWTPSSAGASPVPERKEFRPVQFESPILGRKKKPEELQSGEASPPWKTEEERREITESLSQSSISTTSRIVNSHSAPSQGLNTLASTPRLPRAQNPTITLLQKAREGQLPKGAAYIEENEPPKPGHTDEKPLISPGEIIYTVKKEYESEPESENEPPKKMADLGPRKFEGIGPTTKEGIPLVLRSEVKENNQTKWYKKMYDSLHRADRDDDYVTIRYKSRRGGRYGSGISSSGYLSEPEPRGYSDRSVTLDSRRRLRGKENDFTTSTMPRKNGPLKYSPEVYKNQPGRIEDYEPGRSSIAEKETKEWWDEVMDIFDGVRHFYS
ncbi:hypothetical protein KPH14_011291 [Odynerus spinipes]|uniref:PDZ domain-containing protein n=1 Tax=Odynerus spinipes TaxID=1348599 RepID=A0AAD9R9H3_9HYME|nr:hypothetical protein KPH14_011291 [Odynerus spinipes]